LKAAARSGDLPEQARHRRQILTALTDAEKRCDRAPRTSSLAHHEREHIRRVLDDCHGNKSQAAKRLGISRASLQRKLSKNLPGQ